MNVKILQGPMGAGKSLFLHKYIYQNNIKKDNIFIFKEKENFQESTRAGVILEGNYIYSNNYKDIFNQIKNIVFSINNSNIRETCLIVLIDSILLDIEVDLSDTIDFFKQNSKFFMSNIDLFIPSNPVYYTGKINFTNCFLTKKFDTLNFNCYCYIKNCSNPGYPKNIKNNLTDNCPKDTKKDNYVTLCDSHFNKNSISFDDLKTSQVAWMKHVYFYKYKKLQNLNSNVCIKGFYSTIFYNILLHCTNRKIVFSEIHQDTTYCNKKIISFDFNSFDEEKVIDIEQVKNCDKCKTLQTLCSERNYNHVHLDMGFDTWVGIDSDLCKIVYETDKLTLIDL